MPNYQDSKIYKVICSETGKIYIGSTTQKLCKRLWEHKTPTCKCLTKTFINPKIFLIENVPCNSKEELHAIERKFIENTECVNYYIPTRTKKEWIEDNKKYLKEWKKEHYQKNKKTITKIHKQYYEKNKQKIIEQTKEYKEKHLEESKKWKKDWYEKNKERMLKEQAEKIVCECGSIISIGNKLRHLKTKKHLNYLNSINTEK